MLNPQQLLAVEYNKGPLLIIAGAGTGKTTLIVEKIKYIIKNNLAKSEEILALTFTEKAAYEMEERVDQIMPYGYFQMTISTFHSFADNLLKDYGHHIGLPINYKLLNEAEEVLFLKKNLFLFKMNYFRPLGNPHRFIKDLINHFSRLKDENITTFQYISWAENKLKKASSQEEKIEAEKYQELAYAYQTYENLKIKSGYLNFSDLIFYLIELFKKRQNLLKQYRHHFQYVFIDEFQDTNISQYELIKLLCPKEDDPKLTVVGDDSQAIYKFRGASVSNILTFMKDYPQAKQITLTENYRSNQVILDKAYQLIKHNDPDTLEYQLGISKRLISKKNILPKDFSPVNFYISENIDEEVDYVVENIKKLKKNYQYQDIAILCRANNHALAFIKGLIRNNIPYQFLGPSILFKQKEIKDLISYLKVLYNLDDSISLFRVLTMDIFKIDTRDLHLLLSLTKKTNLSLFQVVEAYLSSIDDKFYKEGYENIKSLIPLLKEETKNELKKIYRMIIKHLSLIKKDTAGQILFSFLEDSGYLKKLIDYKTEKEEKITLNITKFFHFLKNFEAENEDASVFNAVEYIEMVMELKESPLSVKDHLIKGNAVNILTVHSAKGLEFPVVFIVNLTKNRFPSTEKSEKIPLSQELIKEILPQGDYHLEEERRLFYVAMTRAKDILFLTASYFYADGKRKQKISPFVYEALGKDFVEKIERKKETEKKQLSIFDFKKTSDEPFLVNHNLINNFSYSQLDDYGKCPLMYKYKYVLRIPTAPVSYLVFGNIIHKTLQEFYKKYLENPQINPREIFILYKKNWLPLGFTSSSHEKKVKENGKIILENFIKKFHHPNLKILGLEKKFKIKIKDFYLNGKIDRVDQINDKEIEIIDYKTGQKPEEKTLKKNIQLSIYALAASDKNFYNKKIEEINLSYYYLEENTKITLKKTQEELNKVLKEIEEKVKKIRQQDFLPKPGFICQQCPFKNICNFAYT